MQARRRNDGGDFLSHLGGAGLGFFQADEQARPSIWPSVRLYLPWRIELAQPVLPMPMRVESLSVLSDKQARPSNWFSVR